MFDLLFSSFIVSFFGGIDLDINKFDSSLDTYIFDEIVVGQKMTKFDDSIFEDDIIENIFDFIEN